MWRRVLSQSPSEVPTNAETSRQTLRYLEGWKALGALLHSGGALSGHERNCCFLNTHGPRFADASAAIGLDQDADSRGYVAVDWDGDGDLDLWSTNRTRPRIRFLQNELNTQHHYLALRLRGVKCNRDAIGAKVRVDFTDPAQPPLVKTISAGEGLVSQGSKSLHFGLGQRTDIQQVVVTWPGGDVTPVADIWADGTFEITQGNSKATRWRGEAPLPPLTASPLRLDGPPTTKRVVLPRRLPLPNLTYTDLRNGTFETRKLIGRPVVINLWATWCQPCLEELSDWAAAADRIRAAGLEVLTLNVDLADQEAIGDLSDIRAMVERLQLPFRNGVADARAVELLEATERSLLLHQAPLPIPTSFLVDEHGRLAVVYKGPLKVETLLADLARLDVPPVDPRDPAVPFRGRWLTDPSPPDLTSIASQLVGAGRGQSAYTYLMENVLVRNATAAQNTWDQLGVTPQKLTNLIQSTAGLLVSNGQVDEAIELYQNAIDYQPNRWNLQVRLAGLLIRQQRSAEAIALSQRMSRLKPNHPLPWNNLAWVLATSSDASIRDPERAVEVAQRVCTATKFREPSALDTLAVAYAANQQFDKAVESAEQAITRCHTLGLEDLARKIQSRVERYRKQAAHRAE